MMKHSINILVVFLIILLVSCNSKIEIFEEVNRLPLIFPDYTDIVIPPNIAPLNFKINEAGTEYEARIFVSKEKQIVVRTKTPSIQIDIDKWHHILQEGKGSKLFIEVFVRDMNGNWQKFQTISDEIAREIIDNHLVYRLINTGYILWNTMGIYQRNIENFDEKPILENNSIGYGCLNCHSFCKNDPDNIMIHIRETNGGTIVSQDGKLTKIDTKSKYTLSTGVYPCWHPDGKHIAFSVNNIFQNFYSGEIRIEVSDGFSDIVVYDIKKNTITTSVKVSTASRENLPVWSPDGKYIYFVSAPPMTGYDNRIHAKYELMRISFDVNTNIWGEVDTILSSRTTGKSISFPKISPDGKFLMFCMNDYGYFTIHHPMADLYLLNLETGNYNKMEINSPQTDSYHSFSSTGNWFVFSSKRMDGLFTRPFFSYLDENGKASKPFVLPQKSPEFYDTFIKNYNVPELITGEVKVSSLAIRNKVIEDAIHAKTDPSVDTIYMKKHLARPERRF
jgi:hypothetical protein